MVAWLQTCWSIKRQDRIGVVKGKETEVICCSSSDSSKVAGPTRVGLFFTAGGQVGQDTSTAGGLYPIHLRTLPQVYLWFARASIVTPSQKQMRQPSILAFPGKEICARSGGHPTHLQTRHQTWRRHMRFVAVYLLVFHVGRLNVRSRSYSACAD
jgi:hypothetical protein